ncbi:MAG: PAS domain-containing protein [archaeon]
MTENPEKAISYILKGERFGKSTSEIAEITKLDRRTVIKALDVMKTKGIVDHKQVGMAKLWVLTKTPLLSVLERDDESAALLKKVLDSLEEGISILDRELRVIYANETVRGMAGRKGMTTGLTCHKLIMGNEHVCSFCPATESFKTGKVSKTYHKQGRELVQYISSPVRDEDGNVAGVIEIIRPMGKTSEIRKILGIMDL